MQGDEVFIDAYGRLPDLVNAAVDGLTAEQLHWAPAEGANTIGWLVWHAARIQDHLADSMGEEQLWVADDFAESFGLERRISRTPGSATARVRWPPSGRATHWR
ncbi:DinB family protein [Streptomyces sp. NPDC056663]|uniref:DinB family protein n=1 Tax=Streptomyces sp. NPDC056663 TaxID=3345899 RepID=UPI0036804E51